MNREQWLEEAVNELRPMFKRAGFVIPKVHVSVGWPLSGGNRKGGATIGQAWDPENSEDKTGHVFISPVLSDNVRVLDVLTHELGHIVVGVKHGHKAPFVCFCKAIGLEGKPTATEAGDALKEALEGIVEKIGEYPHARLAPGERKVQGTRLLKVVCPDCGYVIRVTQKWIDEGYPTCPCGAYMGEPDEDMKADPLKFSDSTIEYKAHNGRFTVRYMKTVNDAGRITSQKWYVTDWDAYAIKVSVVGTKSEAIIEQGDCEVTPLATRDDVIGFMEAVLQGVYKYGDKDVIDTDEDDALWDDEDDSDDDTDDFLDPDEIEVPDVPEDGDMYPPNPDENEPVEIV